MTTSPRQEAEEILRHYGVLFPETVVGRLLPVVDRLANQRAAAELHKAADWIWDDVPARASASAELHARADALDPT